MPNDMTGEYTDAAVVAVAPTPVPMAPAIDYSAIERRVEAMSLQEAHQRMVAHQREFVQSLGTPTGRAKKYDMQEYMRRAAMIDDCTPSRIAVMGIRSHFGF